MPPVLDPVRRDQLHDLAPRRPLRDLDADRRCVLGPLVPARTLPRRRRRTIRLVPAATLRRTLRDRTTSTHHTLLPEQPRHQRRNVSQDGRGRFKRTARHRDATALTVHLYAPD